MSNRCGSLNFLEAVLFGDKLTERRNIDSCWSDIKYGIVVAFFVQLQALISAWNKKIKGGDIEPK